MNKATKRAGSSDLIPGLVAAGTFLLLALMVHFIPLPVDVLLAIGTYFGVKMLLPMPAPELIPARTVMDVLVEVCQATERMPPTHARQKLQQIEATTLALLRYGEAHPDRMELALDTVRHCLDATRLGVQRYTETSRYSPTSALQSERTLLELLDTVVNTLEHLHTELVEKETADLTGELHSLNKTLKELDTVWLNNIGERHE